MPELGHGTNGDTPYKTSSTSTYSAGIYAPSMSCDVHLASSLRTARPDSLSHGSFTVTHAGAVGERVVQWLLPLSPLLDTLMVT